MPDLTSVLPMMMQANLEGRGPHVIAGALCAHPGHHRRQGHGDRGAAAGERHQHGALLPGRACLRAAPALGGVRGRSAGSPQVPSA